MSVIADQIRVRLAVLEAREVLTEAAIGHLRALECAIWGEACYDPFNEATQKFASSLLPHITALNEELKFKV